MMSRHFSSMHLGAAMLALATTVHEREPATGLSEEDEAHIFDGARRIAKITGHTFDEAERSIRLSLAREFQRDPLTSVPKYVEQMVSVLTLVSEPADAPAKHHQRDRSVYAREPRNAYERALLVRWPHALDNRRRASNSAEFSVVAHGLGATDEEIREMIAAINGRKP
jgi:hypothetical protein